VEKAVLFDRLRDLVCKLICVAKVFNVRLSRCSFMLMFRTLLATKQLVSSKVHLRQLGTQPWDENNRQCALKACTHQTGIMVPLHVGRRIKHSARTNYRGSVVSVYDGAASSPQEKIEKWLRKCPKCFIVCSTNCLRHVNAAIHGLGGLWRDVQVVRGTHPIPATLERRYLAGSRRIFEGVPGQFDALIDELDVITPERRT